VTPRLRVGPPWLRALALLVCTQCHSRGPEVAASAPAVAVQTVTDEADAALHLLEVRQLGLTSDETAWRQLFESDGYLDLKRRELGMRRPFTDSAFRAFLLSDTLRARTGELRRTLDAYRHIDIAGSAKRALAYLPDGAFIRARLYLEIKPRTNSFVYPVPSGSAIFLYLDPAVPRERAEQQIVTHELHHIGISQSCPKRSADVSNSVETARTYAGALAEGLAMLAAAGSPEVDPHATSAASVRDRWTRDYAQWPRDLRRVERFLLDVGEGRLIDPDSIAAAAAPFWGDAQGPWYTVGYAVAATIERVDGRETLRNVVCDPATMLAAYNDAVTRSGSGDSVPRWDERLIAMLRR
jgi:hypothetical protein